MLGAVKLLDEKDFTPVPKLRLIHMPTASYMGALYETQKKRHPLEKPLAEIYDVAGAGKQNGIYAVPVKLSDSYEVTTAFVDYAQKITKPISKKKGEALTLGNNDLGLDFDKKTIDFAKDSKLRETLVKGMRKAHARTQIVFG